MSVFYHYTSLKHYSSMMKGVCLLSRSWERAAAHGSFKPGFLSPVSPLLGYDVAYRTDPKKLPDDIELPGAHAIFGVLDIEHEAFWNSKTCANVPLMEEILLMISCWSSSYRQPDVMDNQVVLLEIEVAPEDQVYVLDFGTRLESLDCEDDDKAYLETLVPFSEYCKRPSFDIPEVVCFSDIPIERVKRIMQDDVKKLIERKYNQYGHNPRTSFLTNFSVPVYTCPLI